MSSFVSAVIVAAGDSTRMGKGESKQFLPLLGKPAISYTLRAFQSCALINEIIVVCRDCDADRIRAVAEENVIDKLSAVVEGGSCRAESVKNGLESVSASSGYVAIHDGARPLITAEEIEAVCAAAFETGAAAPGTAVTDTIKIIDGDNMIESTPDRSALRAVQTPQVFEKELYAFALSDFDSGLDKVTDDCALIENMGGEVIIVEGSRENIKLTTPIDVVIAESILKNRSAK